MIEITNRDDLRVGDEATFAYKGHKFSGPVWADEDDGDLCIGIASLQHEGRWHDDLDFVEAMRPDPVFEDSDLLLDETDKVQGVYIFHDGESPWGEWLNVETGMAEPSAWGSEAIADNWKLGKAVPK